MVSNDNLVIQALVSYLAYNFSGQQPDTFCHNHELHTHAKHLNLHCPRLAHANILRGCDSCHWQLAYPIQSTLYTEGLWVHRDDTDLKTSIITSRTSVAN